MEVKFEKQEKNFWFERECTGDEVAHWVNFGDYEIIDPKYTYRHGRLAVTQIYDTFDRNPHDPSDGELSNENLDECLLCTAYTLSFNREDTIDMLMKAKGLEEAIRDAAFNFDLTEEEEEELNLVRSRN